MTRGLGIASVLLVLAGTAGADELRLEPLDSPNLSGRLSLTQQLYDTVDGLSFELGSHLSRLSLETIAWEFDVRKRRARLGFDTGDEHRVSLRLDSNIKFERGYARVRARINLGLGSEKLEIELPEVDLVPRSYEGQRYVEIRLPLLRGSF